MTNYRRDDYLCAECGAKGCKLWREYQTFLEHQVLRCVDCALRNQNKSGPVDEDGRRQGTFGKTDQIGWLIPACPTKNGSTFWGYSSVPPEACAWWDALPLRAEVAS